MTKRQRASSSSLFLMELILAILFFCIAATICISVFAKSHLLHRDAGGLNGAVFACENAAEIIRSKGTVAEISEEINGFYEYKGAIGDVMIGDKLNNNIIIQLDADFKPTGDVASPYIMTLESQLDGSLLSTIITVYKTKPDPLNKKAAPLYELYVEHTVK